MTVKSERRNCCLWMKRRLFSSHKQDEEREEDLQLHRRFSFFRRFYLFFQLIATKSREKNGMGFLEIVKESEEKNIIPPCMHLVPQVLNGFNNRIYNEFGAALMVLSMRFYPAVSVFFTSNRVNIALLGSV